MQFEGISGVIKNIINQKEQINRTNSWIEHRSGIKWKTEDIINISVHVQEGG